MIVVSDSSPLILLSKIDCLFILPQLFGTVVIPEEVANELHHEESEHPERAAFTGYPWLQTNHCRQPVIAPGIDLGESAAIGLAQELRASLLIDDQRGRKMAAKLGLTYLGSVGVLEPAASERLIQLNESFTRIKQTDFFISHEFLDQRLALHLRTLGVSDSP